MNRNDLAIQFLLNSSDPSIRYFTLTDLLGATSHSREATAALRQILDGPRVQALLAGQHIGKQKSPESYGVHPGGLPNPPHTDGFGNPSGAGVILQDARVQEALDIVEAKRQPDGCWKAEGFYWAPLGKRTSNVEVVDWGRQGPNEMITLNALRVLKVAGRV